MKHILIACMWVLPMVAVAAPTTPPDIASLLAPDVDHSATFAFAGNGVIQGSGAVDLPKRHVARNATGSYSKNKLAFWASADIAPDGSKAIDGHASALWEKSDAGWKLIAFSIVPTATAKQQQAANKQGLLPPKIRDANGAGGDYFLTVFDKVFGNDAVDTVSDHKDAVMFGSGPGERYVGGDAIKKVLTGWNLAFTMRDGIASGVTKGRLLWIAANMNARPANNDKAAATPYRVFLIFEGSGDSDYQLVHASFAAMTEQAWP
ncbi:MAG TPA: hypothetical protein VGG28_31000 [Kofleriaceae bacterium]|jgi:hypothetical protein